MDAQMPWWVKPTLAAFVLMLLLIALVGSYWTQDDANRNIIVGAIIAQFAGTVGYYFGSSDSSQKKDATIASQGAALATSIPTQPPGVAA